MAAHALSFLQLYLTRPLPIVQIWIQHKPPSTPYRPKLVIWLGAHSNINI